MRSTIWRVPNLRRSGAFIALTFGLIGLVNHFMSTAAAGSTWCCCLARRHFRRCGIAYELLNREMLQRSAALKSGLSAIRLRATRRKNWRKKNPAFSPP